MEFDVYCDESHPDLLISKKSTAQFLVIGSLWLETKKREQLKTEIKKMKSEHLVGGEIKWGKASNSRSAFYNELLCWFFRKGHEMRFRAIVINQSKVQLLHFHENDQELGFYKFYYQLLHHWIKDFNNYHIFCDLKKNRKLNRLQTLRSCLRSSNLSASVSTLQSVRSNESVLIQMADFLTGLVSAKYNHSCLPSSLKQKLIANCEEHLGNPITATGVKENKFNVFEINLKGGW